MVDILKEMKNRLVKRSIWYWPKHDTTGKHACKGCTKYL